MKISSVVIAVDFSPSLSRAGEWVRRYIAPNASITLVNAYDPTPLPGFLRRLLPPDQTAPRRELQRRESALAEWRQDNGLTDAQCVVRAERAHTLIQRVMRDTHADLVVIGARATGDRPWMRLGSTAERLLRGAEASLLVMHDRARHAPRKLLVALDDAAITPTLLTTAGELADRFNATVHGVHVLSNAAYSHVLSIEAAHFDTEFEAHRQVEADMAAETLRWLRELWKNTDRHGKLEAEVLHGVPGTQILEAADRIAADLIVIGRYGIGRAVPAVLGSVVGSVVHGALCPVLVVTELRDSERVATASRALGSREEPRSAPAR
jgi:nucleotide-binding universal stress UspA family protein